MTLRVSLRGTVVALRARPELFALGGAIGLLQAGVLGLWFSVLAPDAGIVVGTVAVLLSLFVVLPLFVGLYELTLRPAPAESSAAALLGAVGTTLRRYPRVLVTDAVAGIAAALVGLLVALGWYVAATAGRYGRYALGDPAPPAAFESAYLLVGAALVGAFLASPLFRFADCLTAFDGHSAVAAVARSAAAGRRHLTSFAGFAALVIPVHLGALGLLVAVMAASTPGGARPSPVGLAVVLLLYGVVVTSVAVLQAAFFRDHVAPRPGAPVSASTPVSLGRLVDARSASRVAVAVVLVAGLVTGAAAVRTLDPAVHSPPELAPTGTDDPDEAVRAAAATTARANHRQVVYVRNASDPDDDFRVLRRAGYDPADRQLYVYYTRDDGEEFGGFFADGTMALLQPGGRFHGLFVHEYGPWQVLAAPGWGIAGGGGAVESSVVPGGDADGWRVVSANASTMVVRYDDPDTVDDALGSHSYGPMAEPMANESHVTAVVDRERGVLDEASFHLHSLETGKNRQYRIDYREVGTADLARPDRIRDRRLVERFWDALYY